MSQRPDFSVTTYGDVMSPKSAYPGAYSENSNVGDMGPRGGGWPFSFPWSGRNGPYNPNGPTGSPYVEPYEPQGPPEGNTGGPPPEVAGLFAGLSAKDWIALGTAITGLVGGAVSNRNNQTTPTTATTDPQLKELLALMSGRLKKSEPLHDSVLSMANGLLPTQYQRANPLISGG